MTDFAARERQEAYYQEIAQLRLDIAAMERRAKEAEQTAAGIIEVLRPILPSGFRGDNPIWACEKLVDWVQELRSEVESSKNEVGIAHAERDLWQQKCGEVSQELAAWLSALNEWADTNSRTELTGADRKLFELAREENDGKQ